MVPSPQISILMSIYAKEKEDYFEQAMESIRQQTFQKFVIILVVDGPLPEAISDSINRWKNIIFENRMEVIPLTNNVGLTQALNEGLHFCPTELVARMDTDDISEPARLEQQYHFMKTHPTVGVISSAMYEFENHPQQVIAIKKPPIEHDAIIKQFPYRNPINHPAVMFRKSLVLNVRGYQELKFLEDYYLWVRMYQQGVIFHNLDTPLLRQRFNYQTLNRRGGWINFKNECFLRWYLYKNRLASPMSCIIGSAIQVILRFSPTFLRKWIWKKGRISKTE